MKYLIGIFICFAVINLIIYLLGSFIALDLNPMNWTIMVKWYGRAVVAFLEIFLLLISVELADGIFQD